jgi:hypothetical protein
MTAKWSLLLPPLLEILVLLVGTQAVSIHASRCIGLVTCL